MWKSRALILSRCLAALPLFGCAGNIGIGPQSQAAPALANAASPVAARVYAAGPGAPTAILVMLPGPGDWATADPALWAAQGFDVVTPPLSEIYRIAADRDAALAQLVTSAREMANAPVWLVGPSPAIEAALAAAPMAGPGQVSGVVVTSVASGAGSCTQSMTYSYAGNGAAPKVEVSKSGNACPQSSPFGGSAVGAGSNAAVPAAPAVGPKRPRLIDASVPANRAYLPRAAVHRVAELIKGAPSS